MTIRDQVYAAVSDQAAQTCINQHTRNIHTLYATPDGRVYWSEEVSTSSYDVLAGTVTPIAVIYQTGAGSCGCNCDACMAGDDPAIWAGDDANELLDELIANVDAIGVGYFDDEQVVMEKKMDNRWIVYTGDGTEICDCETRREAYDEMQARAKSFRGTYELTENSFSEDEQGFGHLTQIAAETFTF